MHCSDIRQHKKADASINMLLLLLKNTANHAKGAIDSDVDFTLAGSLRKKHRLYADKRIFCYGKLGDEFLMLPRNVQDNGKYNLSMQLLGKI